MALRITGLLRNGSRSCKLVPNRYLAVSDGECIITGCLYRQNMSSFVEKMAAEEAHADSTMTMWKRFVRDLFRLYNVIHMFFV